MNRTIVHMDLDSFFVSVERLLNPDLQDKAVIVGGSSNRGVVSSCSYEARKKGVRSAMPIIQAKRLCPEAIIVGSGMGHYSKYSQLVTAIIREESPQFEKSSIDEFYIDFSGLETYFNAFEQAQKIRRRVAEELGLPISFGMASSKTVAKIATGLAKPNGALKVEEGKEMEFLAPLKVGSIPFLGKRAQEVLAGIGVTHVKQLQEMPLEQLEVLFGKHGKMMWQKARGIDYSEISEGHERKSISSERTFAQDVDSIHKLSEMVSAMIEKLCYQLRKEQKLTACVALKVRYSDFKTHTQQKHIPYTCYEDKLTPVADEILKGMLKGNQKVRLIGVRFSDLVKNGYQIDLFDTDDSKEKLYKVVDSIRDKHGLSLVKKASNLKK